jgi:hypothetical protein
MKTFKALAILFLVFCLGIIQISSQEVKSDQTPAKDDGHPFHLNEKGKFLEVYGHICSGHAESCKSQIDCCERLTCSSYGICM